MRECPMADSGPLLVSGISRPPSSAVSESHRYATTDISYLYPSPVIYRDDDICRVSSAQLFLQPGPHPLRQSELRGRRCEITFNPLIVRKMDHYVLSSVVKSGLTVVRYSELVVKNGVLLLSMVI